MNNIKLNNPQAAYVFQSFFFIRATAVFYENSKDVIISIKLGVLMHNR
jgi:hypothetical protein